MLYKTVSLFCCLFISFYASGQIRELQFDRLTVEDGLPENYIRYPLQDKYGYLWLGTQNGLARYDGYQLKVYKLETADKQKIAHRSISSLFEDSKGNIWVGTAVEGLFLFNRATGNFTRLLHPENELGAWKDYVTRITEDAAGYIWTWSILGSTSSVESVNSSHLDRIDPVTGKFTRYDSSATGALYFPSSKIFDLTRDSKKNIWAATGNGLFKYNAATNKSSVLFSSSGFDQIIQFNHIYEAPSQPGIMWLSVISKQNGNSLWRYDTHTGDRTIFRHQEGNATSLPSDTVNTFFEDKEKRLWIGTAQGISFLNRRTGEFTNYMPEQQEPGANGCMDIKQGKDGALWGVCNYGILYLSSPQAKLKRLTTDESDPNGLPGNYIKNSLIDRNGTIWFGSTGLLKLNEQKSQFAYVHHTNQSDNVKLKDIRGIVKIPESGFIVATVSTLFEADDSLHHFKKISIPGSDISEPAYSTLILDKKGMVWIGNWWQGLFSYNPVSHQVKKYISNPNDSNTISSNNINVLYEDSKGNLWVGTSDRGLCKMDRTTGNFTRYPFTYNSGEKTANGELDDACVLSILEDRKGILWVGTNGGGLNKYDPATGKFAAYYEPAKGLLCVTGMYEDKAGRFWLGTFLWGLFLFDRNTGKWKHFLEEEGLVYDNVSFIKEDRSGKIWISSGRGFSILDPKDFSIKPITSRQGLPSNDLSSSRIISVGNEWLVTTNDGIIRFNPDGLSTNQTPPQIHIQSLSHIQPDSARETAILIDKQQKIELAYNQNRLSFQYVAIHYTNPLQNQYQYQLEGYDKNWIQAGTQRIATYTNLSPGTYTFLVKAANSDGIWSKDAAKITVIIHPPWWKTWWAYTLYTLLIALTGYALYRVWLQRVQDKQQIVLKQKEAAQAQAMEETKSRFFANITHELRTPLTLIMSPVQKQLQEGETTGSPTLLKNVYHNSQLLLRQINQLLDMSKLESGSLPVTLSKGDIILFIQVLVTGFKNAALAKKIDLTYNPAPLPDEYLFDSDKLEKMMYNLLGNALKFTSEGGNIQVVSSQQPIDNKKTIFQIQVSDSGIGIAPEHLPYIFNRFYQVNSSTTRRYEGTGIGLSLVKELTELMGGKIQAQSTVGKGSIFSISLPLTIADTYSNVPLVNYPIVPEPTPLVTDTATKVTLTEDGKNPLILIADDNEQLRLFMAESLAPHYQVITATDGEAALQTAIAELPELIISDVMMPVMDGYEFCSKVKENPLTAHIGFVMLTAKRADESRMGGLRLGADHYLGKPFIVEELLLVIGNLLKRQQKLREFYSRQLGPGEKLPPVKEVEDEFLRSVYTIIESNLDSEKLDVEYLASALSLTRRTLNRKLTAIADTSANEIIRNYRLKKAAEMLLQGENVSGAAYATGFTTPSYFAQCFKEMYGHTPVQYAENSGMSQN